MQSCTNADAERSCIRAHLIGLKNICFQKIKNQSFHLIGRSVSTPRMVILIFRKFCFQPRSPGGLFLRNYICFIRSSCGLPHRVSQTSSHSTGTSISPETHTRTHGQARTVKYRGRCPTRRRTNRQPLGEQGTSTSANCVPAKRGRACCRREVRHQLTAAATGALLLVAGMTCSPQGKHEPLRIRLRIRLRPVVAVVTKETRTKRAATATAAAMLLLRGRLLIL